MKEIITKPSAGSGLKLSTKKYAEKLHVVPQTVRAGYCRNGNYLGMRPIKLPNGRLLWDADELECLLAGEVA